MALWGVTLYLGVTLIALSIVDVRTMRLPDIQTLPLIPIGIAVSMLEAPANILWHTLSASVAFGALYGVREGYRRLRSVDGLGLGDVKLFAAAGAWVGLPGLPWVLLVGCISALAWVRIRGIDRLAHRASIRIPFGPFLALGFWCTWVAGHLG